MDRNEFVPFRPCRVLLLPCSFFPVLRAFFALNMDQSTHPIAISDESEGESSWSDSILSLLTSHVKRDAMAEKKDVKSSKEDDSVVMDDSQDEDLQQVKRESVYFQKQERQKKTDSPSVSQSSSSMPLFQYMSSSSDIEDIVMERGPSMLPSQVIDKETEQTVKTMQSVKKTTKQLEGVARTASLSEEALLKGMKTYRRNNVFES